MKRHLRRTVSAAAAAAIACGTVNMPVNVRNTGNISAADNIVKYEFEDGKTSGGKIHADGASDVKLGDFPENTDLSGFSGKGFSYLDQKGTTVSIEADVPEDGLYEIAIGYCEPSDPNKKVQYLNVNGVNQGEVSFPYTPEFAEIQAGVVNLKKGVNTIELKAYWGYTFFDYLTVKPADDRLRNLSPTRELSNPNASDSAKGSTATSATSTANTSSQVSKSTAATTTTTFGATPIHLLRTTRRNLSTSWTKQASSLPSVESISLPIIQALTGVTMPLSVSSNGSTNTTASPLSHGTGMSRPTRKTTALRSMLSPQAILLLQLSALQKPLRKAHGSTKSSLPTSTSLLRKCLN